MAEHPEKYEELKDWKKSDLKSGDIQAHNGHIRIVMEDGKKLAHASQCDRTGEITDYYEDTKFRTFRPIGATSTTTDECSPTEGGTGDINQAAIDLAWPKEEAGKHGEHDPKPAYKDALKKYFNTDYGASCSRFVETVVRYSGYDKNFGEIDLPDKGWAYTEGFYMEAHPELWEEVTNGYGKDTMQPGDIQVVKGNGWNNKSRPSGGNHIRIVIKDTDGKFRIAEAAQGKYNGEIKNYEYKGKLSSNWRVFRAKGTTSSTTSTNGGANGLTGSSLIGQTAIKLAWPTNKCTTDPTPEYAKALAETKIGKGSDDHCVVKGASCDRFVGITVRYSGVDKKFGYWIDTGNDERYITVHMERHPEQWQEVTQGYSKENAQDGDILVCDGDGCSGHTLILAKTADGKLKKVEASHTNCCVGRVTGEFKKLGNGYRAWRAKNNPAYNQNCACQVNQQNQQNGIADGGYNSEEEADKAIMNPYKNMGDGVKKYGVVPQDCAGGITSNCSAFSTYFVNRYFKTGAVQQMGYATVDHLISKGWKDGGHTPAVYAVFSQHSTSGCGCTRGGHRASMDSSNHTGVVLGINQAEDKILIGQAGCSASFEATGTYTCSLKCFSKAPYKYAHPPGPPKGI